MISPVTTFISSHEVHPGQPSRRGCLCPRVSGSSVPQASLLLVAGAYLHAVALHRPPQGVHGLPANQDAQVNEQHAPDDHKQFLVLDDLQRGQEQGVGGVRDSFPGRN